MILLNDSEIKEAIELLTNNKVVIIPTDTIYGLSALATPENMIKINQIKKSDINKPLIILISDINQANQYVDVTPDFVRMINSPEPTTVISFKKENPDKTYALRLIKRDDIKSIIDSVGPIYSTSVNISGDDFLTKKDEFLKFSTSICGVFFTEKLAAQPSKILNLWDFSKKR